MTNKKKEEKKETEFLNKVFTAIKQNSNMSESQEKISTICDSVKDFLLEKNRRYGDSALHPIQVFCKESPAVQLTARMDDKLNRIVNSPHLRKNDVVDLIGYLILICAAENWLDFKEFLD